MHYHQNLLGHNVLAFLIIIGFPLTSVTKVMSTEEKSEAHETNIELKYVQQTDNSIQYGVRLSQGEPKIHPFHATPSSLPKSNSNASVSESPLDSSKSSLIESEFEAEIAAIGSTAASNHGLERESEPQLASEATPQTDFGLSNETKSSNVLSDTSLSSQTQITNAQTSSSTPNQDTQKPPSTSGINILLDEGDRQLDETQYDKAASSFAEALRQSEATGNSLGIAKALSGKAATELSSGKYAEAQDSSAQALVALQKVNKKYPDVEADILLRQGYAYLGQEKQSDLENLVKQVMPIIFELKESEKAAGLLVSLADLQYALGKKESGNQSAQKAVSFLQKNPDPSGAIAVLSRLAVSQYASEKPDETAQTLQRITELIDKLSDQPKKVSLLQEIGGLYIRLGESEGKPDKARQSFENARQSFEKSSGLSNSQNSRTEANVRGLLGFGRAYLGLNRNEEAVEQAQQAIAIIKDLEKSAGIQEPEKKPRPFFKQLSCSIGRILSRSSACDDEDAESAVLNQADTVLKRMKRDARDIIAAARLDEERYAESDASLREALQITREIDGRLNNFAKTVRQVQGISGIIALLPLGFVSEFGSYINTSAGSLDQMIALPQGGFSLLDKINSDMIKNSKRHSLDDLKKQQEETQDASAKAKILLQLGSGYLGIGKYSDAGRAFKEAATLFRQLNQSGQPIQDVKETWAVKEAEALLGSGRSLYLERNYPDAQATTQQAADIFLHEGDSLGSANTWLTLGNISLSQSKFSQAKEQLQKALNMFSEAKDNKDAQLGEANTHLALGTVLLRQRNYKDSLKNAEAAIGIFQVLRNETESARARLVRGSAYKALGDHRKALEDAQKALFIFKDRGDRIGEISALNNIGDALQSQRRYEQAIKFYGLSSELQKDLQKYIQKPKPKTGWLVNVFRVGSFFLPGIGTLGQAGVKIYNALSIAQSVVYLSESATSSMGAGFSYLNLGEYDQAMDAFDRVRKASEKQDPQKEAEALLGLSNTRLSFDKEYDMARKDAERAVGLFNGIGDRAGAAYAFLAQGIAYNRLGKSQSNEQRRTEYFREGFGALQQAISTFQDPEILDLDGEAQSYSALADLMVDRGQMQVAIAFYKQSIEVTEKIRRNIPEGELRTVYVGKVVETYRRLIDLLLSQARVPEAQKILELLKAQEIQEYTGVTRASIGDDNEVKYVGIEKTVKDTYGSIIALGLKIDKCEQNCKPLEDQRDQLIEQFEELVKSIGQEISKRPSGQDPLMYDPASLSSDAKDIISPCKKLGAQCPDAVKNLNTMLVYPFIAEDDQDKTKYKLWLLWAAPQGVSVAISRNIDRQLLEKTVFSFYELISTRGNITKLQQNGKQLHDWLIQPLEEQLKVGKINNLVFVLDRFLRYVPMAALFDGNQYLIQKGYQVSTVISAKDTDVTDRLSTDVEDTGILAMGLSKKKPGFIPLEDVPLELEGIVRSVNSDSKPDPTDTNGAYPGRVFLDSNFSLENLTNNLGKENLRKYKYRILHIATHGKFVPGSDRGSFLVLGSGDEQTLKKLTIPQIDKTLQFRLTNIHLVVLSACETALGGNTKPANSNLDGSEIPGLSYSFIQKGRAKAVLASLWVVNSKTTAKLMQSFYWNLANNKDPVTKAEALRRSQLFILTGKSQLLDVQRGVKFGLAQPGSSSPIPDSSHPYYWAPFILIGNGL